ncbi:unnamed protein product [Blepharisma stoltei]|uniref:Ankyrin repeat domain-containing protein n=1 Tax=Blepharisma stoltei TaxID=1481888 RepID=A0AAU9JYH6_9CILI|nr:unnamed protein product [Blepharisma stoltei]
MGCSCSKNQHESNIEALNLRIKEAIERNNPHSLEHLIKSSVDQSKSITEFSLLNDPVTTVQEIKLNPLGYALWLGRTEVFKYLHKRLGADINFMEKLFKNHGITSIDIICQQGYLEILIYYLPIYLANHKEASPQISTGESLTVDFERAAFSDVPIKSSVTAVLSACDKGYINIIDYLNTYFRNAGYVPYYLDIDYQDEHQGENCAMIACRNGNYPMIKFLYETCHANFQAKNKRNESVIQITAAGSRKNMHRDYHEIFVYLIEKVGCDATYNYEETLLLLESRATIRYIEKILGDKGIYIQKSDLEISNKIRRSQSRRLNGEELKAEEALTKDFNISKMIEDDKNDPKSILSSISLNDSKLETPFVSVIDGVS